MAAPHPPAPSPAGEGEHKSYQVRLFMSAKRKYPN
jgi:hypothetical protein